MFFGTTPQIISQFLFEEFKKHDFKKAIVPFAGNFVVEEVIRQAKPEVELHSTDVSLYSRAIGYGLMDKASDISLKEELYKDFPFLANKKSPAAVAVQVIMFTEIAKALLKKDKIPYYRMLYNNAIDNQETYFEKVMTKIITLRKVLKGMVFHGIDACKMLPEEVCEGALVHYDPPVLLGDYEKMFKALGDCFEYSEPKYTQMTDEVKQDHLKALHEKGCTVYYRTNTPLQQPLKGFKEVYRYQYKNNGWYCLYSNHHFQTFVGRFEPLKEQVKNYPILPLEFKFTPDTKIQILPETSKVCNHYRLMWVKKAQMTDTGYPFLIFADGNLIGMVQLSDGLKFGSELILINSDPAAPSRYKRLSKLILYVICTQDMVDWINKKTLWEHVGFTTRVFSNHPVSMKYRGFFDLKERSEDKDSDYDYKLIYQNRKNIFQDAQAGYTAWYKKFGKVVHE